MNPGRVLRSLGTALAICLLLSVASATTASAQEDGPEERDPVEAIAGVPIGEVCALQGTLVLVETVARSNLPPELLRSLVETLSAPFGAACTLVPPRDRLTKCAGDREIGETSQGLIGAAPVGDAVQIIEEIENAAGLEPTASQALFDALACERFEFGQGDEEGDGTVFVPPSRPSVPPTSAPAPTPSPGIGVTSPGTGLSGSTSNGAAAVATPTTPPTSAAVDRDEVAAPVVDEISGVRDQLDLFAVLVCLLLLGATVGALLPDGRLGAFLAAIRRHRSEGQA